MLPRVADAGVVFVVLPMVLQQADRTAEHTDSEIAVGGGIAGDKGGVFDILHQQRFEVVLVGVIAGRPGVGQLIGIIVGMQVGSYSHLFEIALALSGLGLRFGPSERRQEQTSQDGNNGDDDEQFD